METTSNGLRGILSNSEAGQKLHDKLTEESTLESLDRIISRMETIEKVLEKLEVIMERGPGLLAMIGDTADDLYRNADEQGISFDERIRNTFSLLDKITARDTVDKLEVMVNLADKMPGIIAMSADVVDEFMQKSIEKGLEPEAIAETVMASAYALSEARAQPEKPLGLYGLFRSMCDPDRQKAMGFFMHFFKSFGKRL